MYQLKCNKLDFEESFESMKKTKNCHKTTVSVLLMFKIPNVLDPPLYLSLKVFIYFLFKKLRGGSRALTGRVHFWKNLWEMQNFCHFYSQFSLFWSFIVLKIALRTGALHPLLDFSGCKCTRCTRGGTAPAVGLFLNVGYDLRWVGGYVH